MKCHNIYDEVAGKVLIPGCIAVAVSNDMSRCTCRNKHNTFESFEKAEYRKVLKEKEQQIQELEKYNARLYRTIKNLLKRKKL